MEEDFESLAINVPAFAGSVSGNVQDANGADFAIVGARSSYSYSPKSPEFPSWRAPDAIRVASRRYEPFLGNHDFDIGSTLFGDRDVSIVDCGNVAEIDQDFGDNSKRIESAVNTLVGIGSKPVVLGGDDAIPIPVLRGFAGLPNLCIVQLDAHIDWRHERNGVTEGLSSNMRRASEMPHVTKMVQVGIRGAGSASQSDIGDAIAWGSTIVTADAINDPGDMTALDSISENQPVYLAIDADVFDPAIAPGVNSPSFGGLSYQQVRRIIERVASRGRIVGLNLCEVAPSRDISNITCSLAARIVLDAMGAITRNRA